MKGNHKVLGEEGTIIDLIDDFEWQHTLLGDRKYWPDSLKMMVNTCLNSKSAISILWGKDLIHIYNEAYSKIIGLKHPAALGVSAKEVWSDIWDEIGPMLRTVLTDGESQLLQDHPFILNRKGIEEKCYFTFSYSPIISAAKKVEGVLVTAIETTDNVLQSQKIRMLRDTQLRNLFIQTPVGMAILRGPNYIVEIANEWILQIWGRSSMEVMNRPVFEAIPEAMNQGYEDMLEVVMQEGRRIVLENSPLIIIRHGRKEEVFLKLIYEPLREEDGTISGIMIVADDITEQINSRKKIEESEIRLKIALQAAELGIFDWDIPASNFDFSARLAQMFGYTETTGLKQSDFGDRIHPDDRELRLRAHEDAFETGTLEYEARVLWPDQSLHWVRVNGKVTYDRSGNPLRMYGTTMNIDDEKFQAEKLQLLVKERTEDLVHRNEELQKSEERYHKMVEEVQDYAIILLDKDGIIRNWNKGAEKIKRYRESEILGKSFHVFYLPEDRARNLPQKLIAQATLNGRALHEGWRVRKDGSKFWGSITLTALHNKNNDLIGFTKVTRDLTELKLAEDQVNSVTDELRHRNDALQKSEERYQRMISEVEDYAIILLNDEGQIQNWNAGAQKIKGYSSDEVLGKSFRIFYTEEDRAKNLPEKLLNEARTKGKALHEGWRVRKDGSVFWGSIVITTLHSSDGTVLGYSKVTRDLTERKLAEDKMKKYMLDLESQNSALEQFAYVASHDLQEPLRKIQIFIEVIEKNFDNQPMALRYFNKIRTSAQRMSDLIKSVLNYSKLSSGGEEKVMVDLNTVVTNIKSDFELLIEDKHAVIESESLPTIKAVPLQVHQVFSNLISNALKFTDKEPYIRISSTVVARDEIEDAPERLIEGNYARVVVTDNGIGFDQQYEDLIFSMFQRLHGKQEYSGTGIGLALCKKIMENHGGFIHAKGEDKRGASFFVYFPLR